jgi:molybdate transport system regulatory protein
MFRKRTKVQLHNNLWLSNANNGYFGKGRIELLDKIAQTGSISKAAKEMKMSYKAAWSAVNEMNSLCDTPIVRRATGGKGGGGTVLTRKGMEYIEIFHRIEEAQVAFFDVLGDFADDLERLKAFTSRPALRTSARNQLEGVITEMDVSSGIATVRVDTALDNDMEVRITRKSAEELALGKGKMVTVLFKPAWVEMHETSPDDISTNIWRGEIVASEDNELIVDINNNPIVAIQTPSRPYSKGDEMWCYIDPSNALLAI